jgi:hypothetical protein
LPVSADLDAGKSSMIVVGFFQMNCRRARSYQHFIIKAYISTKIVDKPVDKLLNYPV